MEVEGKNIVITGGGGGIGAALARAFREAGAASIVIGDIDADAAECVAAEVEGRVHHVDVADPDALARFLSFAEREQGSIDILCSNAGILPLDPEFDAPQATADHIWQRAWEVNVMAHVRAARLVLPSMVARRHGHLLQTVSAAGLLTMIGSAAYSATKHAAIAFAESLAIAHHGTGVGVSVLAPQAVDTDMTRGQVSFGAELDGVLSATQVAEAALAGVRENHFLILPHERVADHVRNKAADHDAWIAALARLRQRYADMA